MRSLLIVTAVIEGLTGLALFVMPEVAVSVIMNSSVESAGGILISRIGGVAIIALAIGCWQARNSQNSGIITAMLFYNVAVAAVLIFGGSKLGLTDTFIWPTIVLHGVMEVWCVVSVRGPIRRRLVPNGP